MYESVQACLFNGHGFLSGAILGIVLKDPRGYLCPPFKFPL